MNSVFGPPISNHRCFLETSQPQGPALEQVLVVKGREGGRESERASDTVRARERENEEKEKGRETDKKREMERGKRVREGSRLQEDGTSTG